MPSISGTISAQRGAGGDDVVDEQHLLTGLDREPAAQLAAGRAVGSRGLLGEDAAYAELPRDLVGEDHTPGCGANDDVDSPNRSSAVRHQPAQLGDALRPLQDLELLDVALGMAAALELEVALAVRARIAEKLLDTVGDRCVGGHGRYSTPLTLGRDRRSGRAAPTISRCDP